VDSSGGALPPAGVEEKTRPLPGEVGRHVTHEIALEGRPWGDEGRAGDGGELHVHVAEVGEGERYGHTRGHLERRRKERKSR
jgi:hypothetical protein